MDPFSSMENFLSALTRREISALELITIHLDRIERFDPKLHAFVEVMGERAMARARFADEQGLLPSTARPLQSVPLAIKDVFDYEQTVTGVGSLSTPRQPAELTAAAVKTLETAGAIIHGKTHTVELTFGGWGTNSVMGTPWNPWDLETHRVPGGSSSGSAVAVAAGLAAAALGSDTGGSIRTPASHCGIVGVKTSPGVISKQGVYPLCPTHDTVGILTRHVRDASILFDVLTGLESMASVERGVAGLRLGIIPASELAKAQRSVIDLIEDTLFAVTREGAIVAGFTPPQPLESYLQAAGEIMSAESVRHLAPVIEGESSKVDPVIARRVLRGRSVTAADYLVLIDERKAARVAFDQAMDRLDAVLAPTCVDAAIPVSEVDENRIVTPYGRFVNYLDMAAISVPIGLVPPGLPVGIQIAVRQGDDALALRVARAVERLRGAFNPPGVGLRGGLQE